MKSELYMQAATAAAAKAAALQQEGDKAALQAAKKASKLEDQLRAAKAEQEVLITQSEEASARVAAAQAARDRAVKEVCTPQLQLYRVTHYAGPLFKLVKLQALSHQPPACG